MPIEIVPKKKFIEINLLKKKRINIQNPMNEKLLCTSGVL